MEKPTPPHEKKPLEKAAAHTNHHQRPPPSSSSSRTQATAPTPHQQKHHRQTPQRRNPTHKRRKIPTPSSKVSDIADPDLKNNHQQTSDRARQRQETTQANTKGIKPNPPNHYAILSEARRKAPKVKRKFVNCKNNSLCTPRTTSRPDNRSKVWKRNHL
ncbi:unnamed protein product [Linum trigynum]|uniref:Uncharacterized protein n=1 Tax=Linum trigynum TaxID=586398 RepID=A0AAV2FL88_9ROSI